MLDETKRNTNQVSTEISTVALTLFHFAGLVTCHFCSFYKVLSGAPWNCSKAVKYIYPRLVFFSLTSPRIIRLEKKPLDGLGLEVSGGYRVGIYITELQESSVCKDAGLQIGDRLLKVRNCFVSNVLLSFLCVCRW